LGPQAEQQRVNRDNPIVPGVQLGVPEGFSLRARPKEKDPRFEPFCDESLTFPDSIPPARVSGKGKSPR